MTTVASHAVVEFPVTERRLETRASRRAVASPTPADSLVGQFLRYLVVGGVAFLADFGVLVLLTEFLTLHYLLSAAVAFGCGLAANYALSIRWVFRTRSLASRRTEFTIFAIIGIAGLGWNEILLYAGTDVWGLDYRLSKLITVAIVLFWNFGMRKLILFNRPTSPSLSQE